MLACGGDSESHPGGVEPATEAGDAEPEVAEASGAGGAGSGPKALDDAGLNEQPPSTHTRRLFGLEATITPAPEGTAPDAPATIRGVTRLLGTIPEQKFFATDHLVGCREHGKIVSEVVMAKQTGELANVVVTLPRGIDRDTVPPPPEEPVVIRQEGCVFRPHIAVARAGQPVRIENADATAHNVNARPTHGSNPSFNKTQPPKGAAIETAFPRAEVAVSLGCDRHPWMKGWIAVVDHPFWALSDEDGVWSIEVPPGEYLIEAWHERYGTLKGTVEVAAGEVAVFDFEFERPKRKR